MKLQSKITGLLVMPLLLLHGAVAQQAPALALACKVANRLIKDTRFEWSWELQKEVLGMQVIDARFLQVQQPVSVVRFADAAADTLVRFGITTAAPVQVWVNQQPVYEQDTATMLNPKEIAYNRFTFNKYFTTRLHKGHNEILIQAPAHAVIFLRAVTPAGDEETAVKFGAQPWLYAARPVAATRPVFDPQGTYQYWQTAPEHVLPELVIDPAAAYQRESYANWHYSHGTAVWTLLALQHATDSSLYGAFVKKYTRFLFDNYSNLQFQYDSLHAWRGSYHRVFRRTMLDDAGAAALPFAALYQQQEERDIYNTLLAPLLQYITDKQVRLPDGTFCRPEPLEFTVWADDLFMSVPFLVTMSQATGKQQYLDDAVKQVLQFRKYLYNRQTGLYKHGWFSTTRQQSVAYWGRANGWVAWATVVLLEALPAQHPAYTKILHCFQEHMASLLRYQAANGMWHQLLDRPASYEETSCTAIFAYVIAKGLQHGWLPPGYKPHVLKAWEGVVARIDSAGVVHGICQGTEIGADEQFYMKRKTVNNDPRGLGAVIMAGIAIAELKSQK